MIEKPEEEMTHYELQQQRARNIFQGMKEIVQANRTRYLSKNPVIKEAVKDPPTEEPSRDIDVTPANLAEALSSVPVEEPEEDSIEETDVDNEPESVEEESYAEFSTPDPADTNLDDLIDALTVVSRYLTSAKTEASLLVDSIHDTDFETSDFLHSIELSQFNSDEMVSVFNKVREVRRRRRTYKERLEFINELEIFLNNNQNIVNRINALRNQLKFIREKHANAKFRTRIRTDIKEDDRVVIGGRI